MSKSLERIFAEPSAMRKASVEAAPAASRHAPSPLRTVEGGTLEGGIDLDAPATLHAHWDDKDVIRASAQSREPTVPGSPHMKITPPSPESSPERPSSEPEFDVVGHEEDCCPSGPQLVAVDLHKSYRKGNYSVPVLRGVDLSVERGEFLAIVGQSGSGKSTLLHLLGTLDSPDQGEVCFDGQRIDRLPGSDRDLLRNRYFGMIFQFYHLLPELTTLENVLAPLMIAENVWGYFCRRKQHKAAALQLLETVGLGHRLRHLPSELSGGEMQRAAIARALVTQPQLLLADEPTGNLDHDTGREILDILCSLNRQQNLTIVMVTHDLSIAKLADRVVCLTNGRIEEA